MKIQHNRYENQDDPADFFYQDRLLPSLSTQRKANSMIEISKPSMAIKFLMSVLKQPLKNNAMPDPIWWYRGRRNLQIVNFEKYSDTICLMNGCILPVQKIIAFNSGEKFSSFIYVEAGPPPKAFDNACNYIIDGYKRMEMATKAGFSIVLDNKGYVMDDSERRDMGNRLNNFNFMILPKNADPISNDKLDEKFEVVFDNILLGIDTPEDLCDLVKRYE